VPLTEAVTGSGPAHHRQTGNSITVVMQLANRVPKLQRHSVGQHAEVS